MPLLTVAHQKCEECGDIEYVRMHDRDFPPDAAKRRLRKRCERQGHTCRAIYTPTITVGEPPRGMA